MKYQSTEASIIYRECMWLRDDQNWTDEANKTPGHDVVHNTRRELIDIVVYESRDFLATCIMLYTVCGNNTYTNMSAKV